MSAQMTAEESKRALEGLSRQLDRYAELIVRKGAAVKPGQEVVVEDVASAAMVTISIWIIIVPMVAAAITAESVTTAMVVLMAAIAAVA